MKGRTQAAAPSTICVGEERLTDLVVGPPALHMNVPDFCRPCAAIEQSEADVDILVTPAVPGDRGPAPSTESPNCAAGRSVRRERLLQIGDHKRVPRNADKCTMHAVVLSALGAVTEIGIVETAGERQCDGAAKTGTAMLTHPRRHGFAANRATGLASNSKLKPTIVAVKPHSRR